MTLTKEDLLAISSLFEDKFKTINQRLDKIENRLKNLETRITKLEARMDKLEVRMDKLDARMGKLEARMDKLETRMGKLETRMNKLEARIGKLETHVNKLEGRTNSLETYVIDMENRFDQKLKAEILPLKNQLTRIEVDLLENNILPRLNTIETCYVSTYNRYKDTTERMDAIILDVDVLKTTVSEHSKILQAL